MTPQRWAEIKEIFSGALERPEHERGGWLDSVCGGDGQLRVEVEQLLAQDGESLKSPAAALPVPLVAAELTVGELLSHYRVEAKLGEGGMGAVYRAYDTRLRRQVALKVLSPGRFADADSKQRLMREARAASALNHPNIVTMHEIGSEGGVDFIAMEYVEGRRLSAVIPSQGLPLVRAIDYAIAIADALAAAHAAGVIHRDLKPGNIMVARGGMVKLLDFGLARRVQLGSEHDTTLTVKGGILGTPAYMSPEQAEGKRLDARSDVFSFGVLLYEMLTGRQAFSGDSTASILAAVLREEPAPLETRVPADLARVVLRSLRKDPARRYQHMDDVKVELEELKGESDSGKLPRAPPPDARRPWRWLWATAISVAAIVGLLLVNAWLSFGPDISATRQRYSPVVTVMHRRHIQEGGGEGAQLPAWSPDGKSIVYSADGLRLQRIDASESSLLTKDGVHPFFSAD